MFQWGAGRDMSTLGSSVQGGQVDGNFYDLAGLTTRSGLIDLDKETILAILAVGLVVVLVKRKWNL